MNDEQVLYHIKNALSYLDAATAEMQHAADVARGMDTPRKPTIYNQRDQKWAARTLGISNTTIGSDGCLITAAASMLTDAGAAMTPDALNSWLNVNNGYVDGNKFVFASIDKLNAVKFDKIVDYPKPAPIEEMNKYLNAGGFILVQVDFNPDPAMQQHWCRYIGAGEIIDPWYGDVAQLTPRYRGKNAAEAIWRAAYYKVQP